MKQILIILIALILFSCNSDHSTNKTKELNLELSKKIDRMAQADQQMQLNLIRFLNGTEEEQENVEKVKTQLFAKHADDIKDIFKKFGYPNYNIVGKKSAENFYVVLRHMHDHPEVKQMAIKEIEKILGESPELKNYYTNLVDETARQLDQEQTYGTIVDFRNNGQAYIKRLKDSINIDGRRTSMGLDSLRYYLNDQTIRYFQINRTELSEKGILEPQLYD